MQPCSRISDDERSLLSAHRVILVGTLAATLVAYPLWLTSLGFPSFPLFSMVEVSSITFDIAYGALFFATLVVSLRVRAGPLVWAFPLVFLVGFLLDQGRWTPFYLQYALFLVVIAAELSKKQVQAIYALNALRLGVILIYFWAGVHKLNFNYIGKIFPWFISPITQRFSSVAPDWWLYLGIVSPCIETVLALLLIPRTSRFLAVIALIGMHILIMWCLGPLGHNYGIIVWPWNVVMCCLVWTLFRDKSFQIRLSPRRPSQLLMIVVIGLLPALNLLNLWDSNLSMHMYSGNTANLTITVAKEETSQWPPDLQTYLREQPDTIERLEFDYWMWALNTIGNIPTPEVRIYNRIVEHICAKTNSDDSLKYEITEKRGYTRFALNSERTWKGTCPARIFHETASRER